MTVADPLDDILDENHRNTMKLYLEAQPYPPVTQYRVGQMINAEFEGFLQKCEVLKVDCSLMQVVFQVSSCNHQIFKVFPTGFVCLFVFPWSMLLIVVCLHG